MQSLLGAASNEGAAPPSQRLEKGAGWLRFLAWLARARRDALGNAASLRASLGWNAQFVCGALRRRRDLACFCEPAKGSAFERALIERPQLAGVLVWPYQNAAWSVSERIARMAEHYAIVDEIGAPLPFGMDEKLVIMDLSHIHEGCRLVLDQPQWFMREGGLTLNLFVGDFRAISLAFSFFRHGAQERGALVGCIQGRNSKGVLDLYRSLTKSFFGVRPRDFLFDSFRLLAAGCGVTRIMAIANDYRHHRHPYFGQTKFSADYDEAWRDRGGVRAGEEYFEFPILPSRRSVSEIKPGKRSLYRKRYACWDEVEAGLMTSFRAAQPVSFVDR